MANTKEVAMLFDSSHCTGCKGCQVACKQWNMLPSKLGLNENKFSGTYQNPPDLNGGIPACVKTCQPEALKFGPRDEMIALGQKRVEFLKKKGFDKAELYGVNEMGGLHVLQVCQFGHEAYGLPTDPKPNKMIGMMNAMRTVTGVGTAAVLAGLAVSFVAATGYRREKVTVEEAKKHWTPEQRATADREVKELLEKEASGK